jgi:hypothetical protein
MAFRTAHEFRRQARRCLELARSETDGALAFKLKRLAAVLKSRSIEAADGPVIRSGKTSAPDDNVIAPMPASQGNGR